MKRFLIISIALIALCTPGWACGGEYTHNHYLFSVIHRDIMSNDAFTERMNQFWKNYSNGAVEQYHWNEEELLNIAKKKKDNEMVSYLNSLNTYIAICDQLKETWSYPSKEELAQRKRDLNSMITKSNAYQGTKLKPQWTLLAMRANMVLGNHTQNINLWKQKASKLPESVYRDMARNIYAGALLHNGQRTEACNIYAEQGDMTSIKWAMRKHRNLAGIKTIMAENPNSATINFLVQDFVNNTQETIDNGGDKDAADWIDSRIILRNEAMNFVSYAREVVDKKKTDSPALWLAAIGEIQYLFGMYDDAMTTLNKAVDANGTQRMKDNARAIRMVVAAKSANLDSNFSQWMTNELKWLEGKMKDGRGTQTGINDYDYHYIEVLDRLVFNNLAPRYHQSGRSDMATLLVYMAENETMLHELRYPTSWNPNYSTELFMHLNEMLASRVVKVYDGIRQPSNDPLFNYAKKDFGLDDDFFNDLIGTKYLEEGQFAEAIKYFDKVPNGFYENLNISWYLANRDYTKPCWTERQKTYEEGMHQAEVTKNRRADFCREMNQLLEQYTLANDQTRPQVAYDLAKRYYQASYWGDCWWLTAYGHSCTDSARVARPDFVQKAIDYLQESKLSNDATLRLNSLYALAFIPQDPWCDIDYDFNTDKYIYIPRRGARQFNALAALNTYVKQSSATMPQYVSKCDVLKKFRSVN
ncbi:MAG: hypothetical protein J5637_07595 [Prevotella sp.]|nr:hypothetical protein [Prevotella sp.]